jgi:prepilin-type N-terminal cleavage/methylation domain-containing protein
LEEKLKRIFNLNKSQKGFTLIELLIVIAILGILAAVAVPMVSGALANGKVAAANTEVASVQTAAQMYLVGHPSDDEVTSTELVPDELSVATKVEYTVSLPDFTITADPNDEWDDTPMTFDGTKWSR